MTGRKILFLIINSPVLQLEAVSKVAKNYTMDYYKKSPFVVDPDSSGEGVPKAGEDTPALLLILQIAFSPAHSSFLTSETTSTFYIWL